MNTENPGVFYTTEHYNSHTFEDGHSGISIASRSHGISTPIQNSPNLNASRFINTPSASPALKHKHMHRNRKKKPSKTTLKREEIRLTFSFFITMIVFIICWLPFCFSMFFMTFTNVDVPRTFDVCTLILGCLNSSLNPIIYGVLNKKFFNAFKALYSCQTCRESR